MSVHRFKSLVVIQGFEVFERLVGIFFGEQGFRIGVFREFFAKSVAGVFFLQKAGIGQQDLTQFMGRFCAVHFAATAIFYQGGQVSGMVNVGVSQLRCRCRQEN